MRISACLIAKNEEKNIARCIESFKDAADEIVLVDTGSTDRTVEIAMSYGAKVFYYPWDNNFSNARNHALKRAHGDWVIFLDADEYFADGTGTNIKRILAMIHQKNDINSVLCKCSHIDVISKKVKNTDFHIRIFRNSPTMRYLGNIHESLSTGGKPLKMYTVSERDLKIYHTGYSNDIIESKFQRNLGLLLEDMKNGIGGNILYYYLSDCYFGLGNYEFAIKYANTYIASGEKTLGFDNRPYHNLITSMILLKKKPEEILAVINKAIELFPEHPGFQNSLAVVLMNQGKFEMALAVFQKVIKMQSVYKNIETNDIPGQMYLIYNYMASIYKHKNDVINALDYYNRSLHENKYYENSFAGLIKIIRSEPPEEIIAFLKSIYSEYDVKDVEFLVKNLSNLKLGKVLLYYVNVWRNRFEQEDSTVMYTFLANSNYEEAFELFYRCYLKEYSSWISLFSIVSALLSEKAENIELIKYAVKPSYKRIIDAYTQSVSDQILIHEDYRCYIALLKEFILLADKDKLVKLLNVKYKFSIDLSASIGDIFKDMDKYHEAIEQYHEVILRNNSVTSGLYVKVGFCHYKLREYGEALLNFEQALDMGYNNNDIRDLLCWIQEQCNDSQVKQRAASVSEKIH